MKTLKIVLLLSIVATSSLAQYNVTNRNSFLSTGLIQIKESANFGLVFKGPDINYGMIWDIKNEKTRITYEYELGLGILFSRKIPALGFYLKPIDFAYMFRIPLKKSNLFIGPSLKYEYNYNLFPDLQSGFDYWFTNFSLGLNALYDFNYQSSSFRIKLNSSLIGFVSRQPDYRNPYYYDLSFKYAISHLNQDLTFGSLNSFNTTTLEILWKSNPKSRLTIGYLLKYSGYYQNPEISMVSNNIKIIINKKQK